MLKIKYERNNLASNHKLLNLKKLISIKILELKK